MSSEAPAAPDYTAAATETANASRQATEQQTYANRSNVNTPWSQTTWQNTPTWDPTTGQYVNQWTQNTNLTPDEQSSLNSQQTAQKNLSGAAARLSTDPSLTSPLNFSGDQSYGATPTATNYMAKTSDTYANQAAEDAFAQYTNRNQPLQQQAEDRLNTQLVNQGLQPGDAAYDDAMKKLRTSQSDANTNASLAATQQGVSSGVAEKSADLAAGQATFGEQSSDANYQNSLRSQQIQEDLTKRGYTTNQINALLNGQQVTTGPSTGYNAAGVSAGANYSNAAASQYAAGVNATNVDNSNTSTAVGAGTAIASAAAIAI